MPRSGDLYYTVQPADGGGLPALVLVHGAGGRGDQWPHQIRRLPKWRVFAPDLPAHGFSQGNPEKSIEGYAVKLLEWMDALELPQAAIAGHSMGAAIALQVAMRAPERVPALVLLAGAASFVVNPVLLEKLSVPAWQPLGVNMIVTWSFAKGTENRLRQIISAELNANRIGVLHADYLACSKFDVSGSLKLFSRPTLLLCGGEDLMVPQARSRAFAEQLVRGKMQVLAGAGHMFILEKPRETARAMEKFLEDQARFD